MKKNEIYRGIVKRLKFPNKGYVVVDGEEEEVLVKNTLPGQCVEFSLIKNQRGRKEGRLLKVLHLSEIETEEPPCPHFDECGGCAYQNLSYEEQKALKLSQVRDLFKNIYPEFPLYECKESPDKWEYRNKMEFSFGDEYKEGPLTLGLHKRGSFYDIVGVSECRIVHEDFRKILVATIEYFSSKGVSFYHKMSHEGYLRHLLVRRASTTGDLLICLVTSSQLEMDLSFWVDSILENSYDGQIKGILHMINDSFSDVVQSDETRILYGDEFIYEKVLGLRFKVSPFSFFQTNSRGAEKLYSIAREYIGSIDEKVVFDLYSGTGTIAQVLAPVAKKVIGVEIVEEAVEAARENAKRNGLTNCEFIAGDVWKVISDIKEKPDFIILDPPREGVHPKALKKIIEYGVERIVYISCKPTSLARDLEAFLEGGYEPVKAECVDMFPWTRGIETVVLLSQRKPDDRIEVEIELMS